MTAHALLSASSAFRWLNCTASPRLEENMDDTSSIYAKEGSLAHALAEAILNNDVAEKEKLKADGLFYSGMLDEVEEYTNYCLERFNEMKTIDNLAIMDIEKRLDFSKWVPKGFGTGDCIIIGNGLLEIIDLKFGKGVEVSAIENPQLMLYALGALNEYGFIYDVDRVRMTIAQVRLNNISSYEMKVSDLVNWAETEVKVKAKEAYTGTAKANPGQWCGFCKFKNLCKSRTEYLKEKVDYYKDRALSYEEIAEVLAISDEVTKWLKDTNDFALEEALKGVKFPGYKLVEGRSNRKIIDEVGLAEILVDVEGYSEEKVFKPKAIETITNLEKLIGKNKFAEISSGFVVKPEGKPTLVPNSDKRKEINTVEDEFDFEEI